MSALSEAAPTAVTLRDHGRLAGAGRWLRRFARTQPLGLACAAIIALLIALAFAGPALAPYAPDEPVARRLQGPSASHLFGTDELGRDIFSRVLFGARVSVLVGFGAVLISTTLAALIGVICGYFQGWPDMAIQRIVDGVMAFPTLVLLMALVVVVGSGLPHLIVILGLIGSAGASRVVRSAVLSVRVNQYVEAARAIGAGTPRVMARHILPNCFAPMIVSATVAMGGVILAEAALSFLGLGINDPAQPTWGQMLNRAQKFVNVAPLQAAWPGIAIALTVYSFNMLGDALRDVLDPRLRRR